MRRVLRPDGVVLVAFHVGDEVRHATELEEAALCVEVRLERVNYPEEVTTRRAYLLGRRSS